MSAETYLTRLEANSLLLEPEPIHPPEVSNFYWKNDNEEKFKVFIPTPDRRSYYNLEEYEGNIDDDEHGWSSAKKCILLAVSNIRTADIPFINHMEFLIANLRAWDKQHTDYLFDIGYDFEYFDSYKNRHYILTKYLVDDIRQVPMEKRGTRAQFRGTITIDPEFDNECVIHAMNIGFKLAAKRFANDQNHGVYAYGSGYRRYV